MRMKRTAMILIAAVAGCCLPSLLAQPGCVSIAGQENFFSDKWRLDTAAASPRVGSLATEFRQKLAAHPDDPAALYLYGRSLMGKDTRQAIAVLNRAAESAPGLPWTYEALAEIYTSRVFHDEARSLDAMRTFRRLCPGELRAYQFIDKIQDPAEAADWAAALRTLLKATRNARNGRLWIALWAAEFRAAPAADYPRLRERIAADVRRIESFASAMRTQSAGRRALRRARRLYPLASPCSL